MHKYLLMAGALALAGLGTTVHADNNLTTLSANAAATKKSAAKEGWQGSFSFGYVATTGNTNTRSLNVQALAAYRSDPWAGQYLCAVSDRAHHQSCRQSGAFGLLHGESQQHGAADVQEHRYHYLHFIGAHLMKVAPGVN